MTTNAAETGATAAALSYTIHKAKEEDADEVGAFAVNGIREAFTKSLKIGPQESLTSEAFLKAYQTYRKKSISNENNLCRIVRSKESSKEILGYIELGPKTSYKGPSGCELEIICLFTNPNMKGRGIGTMMVTTVVQEMYQLGKLKVGLDRIGVVTMTESPFVRFYEKLGARKEQDRNNNFVGAAQVVASDYLFEAKEVAALVEMGKHVIAVTSDT